MKVVWFDSLDKDFGDKQGALTISRRFLNLKTIPLVNAIYKLTTFI